MSPNANVGTGFCQRGRSPPRSLSKAKCPGERCMSPRAVNGMTNIFRGKGVRKCPIGVKTGSI